MKKGFLKCIAVIMVVLMAAMYVPMTGADSALTLNASAKTYSGSLGNNVKWSYDTNSKTITVSGSGAMKDYSSGDNGQGWTTYRVVGMNSTIKKHARNVVINSGVTYIGKNAFRDVTGITNVKIASSVTSIGQSAFEGCSALTSVSIPEGVTSIGAYAFKNTKFASVNVPYSVKSIGGNAFAGISGLKITCNYGDAAYTYCKNHSVSYNLRQPELVCQSNFIPASNQIKLVVRIKNGSGINAANLVLTYDNTVTPVNTGYSDSGDAGAMTAIVYNETGKVSIAFAATESVAYSACSGECEYTVAEILFNINGEPVKTQFGLSADTVMYMGKKVSVSAVTATENYHNFKSTVTPPTCDDEGYTTYTCSDCGYSYKDNYVSALGHNYKSVVTEPTCTDGGYETFTCQTCKASYVSNEVESKGHDYNKVVTEATCTDGGYTTYTCKNCTHSYVADEVSAKNHDYNKVVTEATCTDGGYTTYTCKNCAHSYVADEVPAKNHDYNKVVTEATCHAGGFTTYTCKNCSDSYVADETDIADHNYEAVVTEATCTSTGYTTYTCSVCAHSYKAGFTAELGHNYDENGECTRCGDVTVLAVTFKDNSGIAIDNEKKYIIINKVAKAQDITSNIASGSWILSDSQGSAYAETAAVATGAVLKAEKADIAYTIIILGDVNYDGRVNAADARLVLRVASRLDTATELFELAGNCDGKAKITASDARLVLRVASRLETFK